MTAAGLVALVACLVAGVGTWIVREYARSRNVLDVPNERSSHTRPTPRGGGAGIVAAVLGCTAWLWWRGSLDGALAIAALGAGGAVALVGFIDDHGGVPARVRLVVHFAAAAWALWWLRLPKAWSELAGPALPDAVGYVVLAFALVWLLNLYNFMDGIDGIAGVEAVVTCAAAAATCLLVPGTTALPMLTTIIAAASLGFLAWNFPPASIFMGDVGSGFLGIILGVAGLAEFGGSLTAAAAWLILIAVFTTDATVTLFRRWRAGASLASAHRTHAYQHAAVRWRGHRPVTLAVAAINLLWLLPLALLVRSGMLPAPAGLLVAYAPLVVVAWRLGAGVPAATP